MPSDFDDHPNVVVMEHFLRKLLLQDCFSTPDPEARLREWLASAKYEHDKYIAVLTDTKMAPASTVNAISIATQFTSFSEELEQEFNSSYPH